ncbi:MAG TPA: hypothetical protein VKW76_14215 [Candidatus Binatia bacterium]|nr:hypothetical protein [Candidatus Binatia bacterium]
MRIALVAMVALAVGGLPGSVRAGNGPADCEAARCAVQAAVNQNCPCSTARNHGQYVSCVAHQVNALARSGAVPTDCKGKVTRCAAKSVCGKAGFVTCEIPETGTCDPTTNTCVENPAIACVNGVCILGEACHIKSSAALCTAKGGTVGTSPTCCAACVSSPSAAFCGSE